MDRHVQETKTRGYTTGIVMMAGTALLFSVMALFVRLAAETVPVGMIIFTRYSISTLFIAGLWASGVFTIRPVNKTLLVMRAVAASFGGVFYFFRHVNEARKQDFIVW